MIACEAGARRVTRLEVDGRITPVAGKYQGTRLHRPNDVVVKSNGGIYFTDPWVSPWDLEFSGVYRVSPNLGTVTLLVKDFLFSNGLTFSPDEAVLYINDTRQKYIRAFDVMPDGSLSLLSDRVFCYLSGVRAGFPDGMKVDVEGNVFCGGSGASGLSTPQAGI